jgi:DtxR family Mn-dependent transcriptional regulator
LVSYQKYQGVTLTENGFLSAKIIVRKHRLWEVFLVDKLGFAWDEVHEIAEELEHIKSEALINKLDSFLNFPTFDPHGDPIPNEKGEIVKMDKLLVTDAVLGVDYVFVGVKNSSAAFLQYLDKQDISLGATIKVHEIESFDGTFLVSVNNKQITISNKIATNLFIR